MRGAFRTKIACSTTDCNLKTQPLRDFHADKSAIRRTPDLPLLTNLTFPIGYILGPLLPFAAVREGKDGSRTNLDCAGGQSSDGPSAPSAPAPIFRMSAVSTTRSGTARTSAIHAIWCPAPSCRLSRGLHLTKKNFRPWWLICNAWDAPRTGVPTTTTRNRGRHT